MTTARTIPGAIVAEVARALEHSYTHAQIENLFLRAGAPGPSPNGNKLQKVQRWLERVNAHATLDTAVDPHVILGAVLQEFMDAGRGTDWDWDEEGVRKWTETRQRVHRALANHGLSYQGGGRIFGGSTATPSRSLNELIQGRDFAAIQAEFDRALSGVANDPPAAVTAACAILEAICKTYIEAERLPLPDNQSLQSLWKIVRVHLKLDPANNHGQDLKRILGGLATVVDGVAALRTHAGSAHGRGPQARVIEERYARLAVHAAHTLVFFLLESWPP